jgi:sulfite exporter TauE/SafE
LPLECGLKLIGIVTALLGASAPGRLMKVKAEMAIFVPLLLIWLALSQGPVSLTSEYCRDEIFNALLPRLVKIIDWLTPPACWPVTTPFQDTVTGLTDRRAAWL